MAGRSAFPTHASVVIIGGGVMGLSTAYNLAKSGTKDIVLLERAALGEGSTARCAGGVRAQFSDEVNIQLGLRSLETFERFRQDFDQEIDFEQVGYLFLLDNEEHIQVFERNIELQNSLGVPSRMIDAEEALKLSPLIETSDLLGAAFSPTDGHCTPESVVLGYATACRKLGVRVITNCEATGIDLGGDAIEAVDTNRGTIKTSAVICTAGAWSQQIGEWVGIHLPVRGLRRQIAVTEPFDIIRRDLPLTIDFSSTFYFHREGDGLLLGLTESTDSWGFDTTQSKEWIGDLAETINHRTPTLGEVGLSGGWAGLYEMTPDHNGLVGEHPSISRFLYATGFSGHGFLMGPAIGEVMRDLFLKTTPIIDVTALDVCRFGETNIKPELNFI